MQNKCYFSTVAYVISNSIKYSPFKVQDWSFNGGIFLSNQLLEGRKC